MTIPEYSGALLKPSGHVEHAASFTTEPAHYDGQHRSLIFFARQGYSASVSWSDGRIHAEIFRHVGRTQASKKPVHTLQIEHMIAGEHVSTWTDIENHTDASAFSVGAHLLERYLPGGGARWEVVPIILSGHPNFWCSTIPEYAYTASDAIATPVRYNPERGAVERLSRHYARDVLRFTEGLNAEPIRENLPREAAEQLAKGWSGWIHDCDRQRGEDYCRRRIAWLIGCGMPHERRGLLALDMEHPHPQAEALALALARNERFDDLLALGRTVAICGNLEPHDPHDTGLYEPGKPRHHVRCPGVKAQALA